MENEAYRHKLFKMKPLKLNIGNPLFKADPIKEVQRLQSYGDLVPVHFPFIGKMWATTRADLTEHVLTHSDLFVSEPKNAGMPGKTLIPGWMPRSIKDLGDNMVVKDDPDHKRLRTLVDTAFAKRSVLELRSTFEGLATSMLSNFEAQLFQRGQANFIDLVSKPMPIAVMIAMLGLPQQDEKQFYRWASTFADLNGIIPFWRATTAIGAMRAYVSRLVTGKKFGDDNGLIAALVAAEQEGDRLSHDELATTLVVLMIAGFETTTHLINGAFWLLHDLPYLAEQLSEDESQIEPFLQECARYISPFVVTKPRLSAVDQNVGGVSVQQGEYILPMVICSNFDDRLFEDPGEFCLNRANANRNFSFGRGIHNCLGRMVAKAQVEALIRVWLNEPKQWKLKRKEWAKRPGVRNMKALIFERA